MATAGNGSERIPGIVYMAALNAVAFEFGRDSERFEKVRSGIAQTVAMALHKDERNWGLDGYRDVRWHDGSKERSRGLVTDLQEYRAGLPLVRHQWLQNLLDERETGALIVTPSIVFFAMIGRMKELTSIPERDMELETATVELGFRLSCGSDYDGNPFFMKNVWATEAYEHRFGTPKKVVGACQVNLSNGLFQLGSDLGYGGDDANRWFVAYRYLSGPQADVPFDAIRENEPQVTVIGNPYSEVVSP